MENHTNNQACNTDWKHKITRFLTAQTITLLGSSLVQYGIVWYITLTTSSGTLMTISTVCGFLPQILISLYAGVWIDRYDRKKLIMLSDSMIALATGILAVLFLTGHKSIWVLFAVLLVRSAGAGIQTPAVHAMIPQIVPSGHLMKVNGINSTIQSLMMFLSPALSGVILSLASIEAAFFIDVATAVIGVGITAGIAVAPHKKQDRMKSNAEEIKAGFRYLRENSFMKDLLIFQVVVLILISPSAFLTPLMVSRRFGAEVWRLTASEMTFSAGAALGGIIITSWGGFKNRMKTTVMAGFAYGALMIALGSSPLFLLYLLSNLAIGVTMPCYNAPLTVMLQEKVEPHMHGRVFSMMQITSSCALPFGMLIFGPFADIVPVQGLLIGCGMVVVCFTAIWKRKMV